jgi:predicted ATPase
MIDHLGLRNFKKFRALELGLKQLTVLTGVNSGGKSSVVQALLLLHSDRMPGGGVPLNGPFGLQLGEGSDVLYSEATEQEIEFSVSAGGESGRLVLQVPDDRSPTLRTIAEEVPKAAGSLRGRERSFVYLSAERLGPRDLQEVAADFEANLSVGYQGQYTAHVLSQLSRRPVAKLRRHPDTEVNGGVITLTAQAEYWMSTIVCPLQIEAEWLPGTNSARLRFKSPAVLTEWLRPANVGFGISYALPIVVAGLTAAEGGLLVIENPESHLHPAGQSAIARFLARIAAAGTQVITETHSDHVLNGFRLAVGAEHTLSPDQVAIHYFPGTEMVQEINLDRTGAASDWPSGFFDQTEQDLSELARAKRRRE